MFATCRRWLVALGCLTAIPSCTHREVLGLRIGGAVGMTGGAALGVEAFHVARTGRDGDEGAFYLSVIGAVVIGGVGLLLFGSSFLVPEHPLPPVE